MRTLLTTMTVSMAAGGFVPVHEHLVVSVKNVSDRERDAQSGGECQQWMHLEGTHEDLVFRNEPAEAWHSHRGRTANYKCNARKRNHLGQPAQFVQLSRVGAVV